MQDEDDGVGVGDDLEDTHAAAACSAVGDVERGPEAVRDPFSLTPPPSPTSEGACTTCGKVVPASAVSFTGAGSLCDACFARHKARNLNDAE